MSATGTGTVGRPEALTSAHAMVKETGDRKVEM